MVGCSYKLLRLLAKLSHFLVHLAGSKRFPTGCGSNKLVSYLRQHLVDMKPEEIHPKRLCMPQGITTRMKTVPLPNEKQTRFLSCHKTPCVRTTTACRRRYIMGLANSHFFHTAGGEPPAAGQETVVVTGLPGGGHCPGACTVISKRGRTS